MSSQPKVEVVKRVSKPTCGSHVGFDGEDTVDLPGVLNLDLLGPGH